jgi:Family of unknown function (DUF5317)
MRLIFAAIVVAILIGYALRGSLRNFSGARIRWPLLALAGLALQLWPVSASSSTLGFTLLMVSFALLFAFGVLNVRNPGFPLIIVGLCLNALVIGVNHGMPVQREALIRSGQGSTLKLLTTEGGAKHHLARPDDRLLFLCDVIPVPKPVGQVVSLGDVFTYAGVMWFVIAAMQPSRKPESADEGEGPPGPADEPSREGERELPGSAGPQDRTLGTERSA